MCVCVCVHVQQQGFFIQRRQQQQQYPQQRAMVGSLGSVHAPCSPSPVLANPSPSLPLFLSPLHVWLPSSYSRRTALRNPTRLVCRNQVSGKKSQHLVPCDGIAEEEEEEEESPQVGIQNCSYRPQPSSWLDKELPHILSMQVRQSSLIFCESCGDAYNLE